jgi:hypothetical protein
MEKEYVGLAGEYAVASEICRRGHFAHLTYGNNKEADILVYADRTFVKVEVKSKTGNKWPFIKGIPDDGAHLMIFVDFDKKESNERPNFYIITGSEWKNMLPNLEDVKNNPDYIGEDPKDNHTPLWKDGNKGIGIRVRDIDQQLEKWEKLDELLIKGDMPTKCDSNQCD